MAAARSWRSLVHGGRSFMAARLAGLDHETETGPDRTDL
jgi:hypothetical protein